MYSIILWVILLLLIPSSNLFSQDLSGETVFSEVETARLIENLDEGKVFGNILFFPELTPRPANDRHQVQVGDIIPICIQLDGKDVPFLDQLKEKTVGFQLILEDNSEPPARMKVTVGNLFDLIKEDAQRCFRGNYTIPANTKSGVYQVSNLFWATKDNRFYSLRSHLYQFGRADELDIKNPLEDKEPPQLLSISTKQKGIQGYKKNSTVLRAFLEETFYFQEEKSEIDWSTLKISYKFYIDQKFKKSQLAQCKIHKKKQRVKCRVESVSPIYEWALNEVSYRLDHVSLQDKAGNLLIVNDPKVLKDKSGEAPIEFAFQLDKEVSKKIKKKLGQISTP